MDTRTDSDLMAAYAGSCEENAFAELVARHQRMVYRVCLRMLRHHQEAEDATQAVFLVLLNKACRLTRKGELTGWLYGVARNVCLEALRKRARRQEEAMLDETEETAVEEYRPAHEEVMPFLDEELAGLTGVLRQAVVLRYLQGYSQAEAAQQAGCSEVTLSVRASRGIERLRLRLSRRGVALSGAALASLLTSEASAAVPETLLPSILATVKTAVATTATGTAATTTAGMLAKGAMKAMFIAKVKMVALVAVSVGVVGVGGVAAVQAVTEKAADKEAPTHQLVTGETFHPIQSAIQDIPLEAEDIARALGLGYWAFSIQTGDDGSRWAASPSLFWYTEGRAESFAGGGFMEKLPLEVRVLSTETETNTLCFVELNKFTRGWFASPLHSGRPTYVNRELSMDDKGRVVLAYELPPGCDTPNPKLRSADGAYRALVLHLRILEADAAGLQPSQFKQETSKLEAVRLATLLGLHHTTFRVETAINWVGKLSCYAEGKKMTGGASFSSGSEERATILFGENDHAFRVHAALGRNVLGATVLRESGVVRSLKGNSSSAYKGATDMDEQGRIVLNCSFPRPVKLTQEIETPEKAFEALVLQLGTGENGQSPLRRNQVSAEKTSDQDLLHALPAYLDLQPLRIFTLAPQTKPIRCRLARYAGGKFENTLAEAMLDPTDLGTPWRFAILQKKEDANHRRIEGVLLANHITIPFRMDCAVPQYLVTQREDISSRMTLDSSGRLLLGCMIALDNSGIINPLPDDAGIATSPEALVLEFMEK